MQLRDYQLKGISDIAASFKAGYRRPLYVLPTGGGKTVIMSGIARSAQQKNKRTYILVHRQELIRQTSRKLCSFGVAHGIIWANQPMTDHHVQVASVQTLCRRLHLYQPADLIIVDEAHHAPASTYQRILQAWPAARVLGVTATPERGDGAGLDAVFDDLVLGPSIAELIALAYLSPILLYRPPRNYSLEGLHTRGGDWARDELMERVNTPQVVGDLINNYVTYAENEKGLCFTVSVEHAEYLARKFTLAGYSAASIDGSMSDSERAGVLHDFETDKIKLLMSCDLVSEGFDVPDCKVGIFARPSKARGLVRQQWGRILRPAADKDAAILLDHAGNSHYHGLPDWEPEWTLEGSKKRKGEAGESLPPQRQCPECYRVFPPAPVCPGCGYVFESKGRQVEYVDGKLELVPEKGADPKKLKIIEQAKAKTLTELIELGKNRGYKHPTIWAHQVYQARQAKDERVSS